MRALGIVSSAVALGAFLVALPHARAIPISMPPCPGWAATTSDISAYQREVPREGLLLLPVTFVGDDPPSGDPWSVSPLSVEVLDEDGNVVSGTLELGSFAIDDYARLGTSHVLFRADEPFTPGGRYTAHVAAENASKLDCRMSLPALSQSFELDVALDSLAERLERTALETWDAKLAWGETTVSEEPCLVTCAAKSPELCPPEEPSCELCIDGMRHLDVVIDRPATEGTPYIARSFRIAPSAGAEPTGGGAISSSELETTIRARYCFDQQCVRMDVLSPLTGQTVEGETVCLPVDEPLADPPAEGAFRHPGNPCAEGSNLPIVALVDPPECLSYPIVSLHRPPPAVQDAGPPDSGLPGGGRPDSGAVDGLGDTDEPPAAGGCGCRTSPASASPGLGFLAFGLLAAGLRRRAQRTPA